jgi:deoxyribonuclease V
MTLAPAWPRSPQAAVALQKELASQVVRQTRLGPVKVVAGLDAAFGSGQVRAAAAVLSYPELELMEYAIATRPVTFPYLPGLLSFREGPAVLEALAGLSRRPDLLIFDGHGLAHPRRFGLACHIGLLLDIPAIGCAKSRLCGRYEEPGPERGSSTLLRDGQEIIGAVVRTRPAVRPVFVSIGHRVDLATSRHYVLACCQGYRLPETTRWAHRLAGGKLPGDKPTR